MKAFDFSVMAENGLRRGVTTGTCVTAAVKASLLLLLYQCHDKTVRVTLPDNRHFITLTLDSLDREGPDRAVATVTKDAGDDPDQTHRCRLRVRVGPNAGHGIRFIAGPGVGTITQPGFELPIGEPAINPIPRQMIRQAVEEAVAEGETHEAGAWDIEVGCDNGESIARRTFNPRLGIRGGISILGTSGVVEPKSMASFKASIEIYIRVALGTAPFQIVLAPGNLGQRFARQSLDLPEQQIVQMSNFIGFALASVEATLQANAVRLPRLWLVGHPGKLTKLLDGVWDTHSGSGPSAVESIRQAVQDYPIGPETAQALQSARTVEAMCDVLQSDPVGPRFWQETEERLGRLVAPSVPSVDEVRARLFQMNGRPLGKGGSS